MKIQLSFSASSPRIVHFNGVPDKKANQEIDLLKKLPALDLKIPEDCCVFSVCTYGPGVLGKHIKENKNVIVKILTKEEFSKQGYMTKVFELNSFLKNNSKYKKVLFVDATDVFFLKPLERLFLTKVEYALFGAEVTFFCKHPDVAEQAKVYLEKLPGFQENPTKYLNSGVFYGEREKLINLTDLVLSDYKKTQLACDQSNYIYSICKHNLPISLDKECKFILNAGRASHLYKII